MTKRERRLVFAAQEVVWWMESTGQDLDGLLSGDRVSLDKLRDALAPYVKRGMIIPLAK